MLSSRRRFRPMGVGDIIDEAFDLYKSNFVLLIGIAATLGVPLGIVSGYSLTPLVKLFMTIAKSPGNARALSSSLSDGGSVVMNVLYWTLSIVGYPLIIGAFTWAISRRYIGEPTTIAESYKRVWQRLGSFILTIVIFVFTTILVFGVLYLGAAIIAAVIFAVSMAAGTGVAIVGGIIAVLLVVGGLIAAGVITSRFALMFPIFVSEGKTYFDCLARSWTLTKSHGWRVFGVFLLTWIVMAIIQGLTMSPALAVAVPLINSGNEALAGSVLAVASAVIGTLLLPVTYIILILVYYDLRIRKEGFDLQMMATDLARSSDHEITQQVAVQSAATCAHCRFPIHGESDVSACGVCGAKLHSACWQEIGGCSTPGCSENRATGAPKP